MTNIVTLDLSQFGYRELELAIELLRAYIDNKTNLDTGSELKICFNTHSGFVFLTDEDCRAYMINNHQLEEWFNCSICGFEGFKEDVIKIENHNEEYKRECEEWIKELKERGC